MQPERINFAIARRCPVSCPGCYTYFGAQEPELPRFVASAHEFAALGLRRMTLSGGDPLTLRGLLPLLQSLRAAGMQDIKVDTVGVGLLAPPDTDGLTPAALLCAVDQLGIPLDGWSNASAALFRRGRPDLHDRSVELLAALDAAGGPPKIVVNTVVHRGNVSELQRLQALLAGLRGLRVWNLFEYTPTDRAATGANAALALTGTRFERARDAFHARHGAGGGLATGAEVAFRSARDRLGHYLLVNSDGTAWLPDDAGITRTLGSIFGREAEVLASWSATADALHRRQPEPATT